MSKNGILVRKIIGKLAIKRHKNPIQDSIATVS